MNFTLISIFISDGSTIGLNESDKGQIGDISRHGTSLWTIGPPTDKLYAVDPVGVDKISPSLNCVMMNYLLESKLRIIRLDIYQGQVRSCSLRCRTHLTRCRTAAPHFVEHL